MKFILYFAFIQCLLLFSLPASSQFQPAEVTVSQQKTIINGRIYYIHTVQKGQTFYSICKAYEITQEEVLKENPGLDPATLKEGQAIRIPDSKLRQAAVYPDNREDFYAHNVKKGQTVYSLSKKYRVTEDIIYQYNPWAREGIKPDQTLWIPRNKELLDVDHTEKASDQFFYYTSREADTLYAISKLYNITVAEIINANPALTNGLKPGMVLKIPKADISTIQEAPVDSLPAANLPCLPAENRDYTVALILPFFAEFSMLESAIPADSINEDGTYVSSQRQQGLRGRNFAEFYEGFLLAVDSMKKAGLSINLEIRDSERDTMLVKKIVRELSLLKPDLIIGPVYSEDVDIAGRMAKYQEINLVSPLSTRSSLVRANPNIVQVMPSRQSESLALAEYIKENNKGHYILIRSRDSASMSNGWRFKKALIENSGEIPTEPLHFSNYTLSDSLINVLDKVLTKNEENIIVVFSENEAEVSRLLSVLSRKAAYYPVKIYGMPVWQTWENIIEYYHTLQLYLLTPFYTDYTNTAVKKFLQKCRAAYGYEPYEISSLGYNFSMLGYDIGLYFLSALKQYGKDFQSCLDELNTGQLLSGYHFIKEGEGSGMVNGSYNLIRYNKDFTVQKVAMIITGD